MWSAVVSKENYYSRLDKFLRRNLPEVPLSAIYKFIRKGKVYVNGKRVRDNSFRLEEGDTVEIRYVDIEKFKKRKENSLEPQKMALFPKQSFTVRADGIEEGRIVSGFDGEGKKIYATFDFELGSLPAVDFIEITRSYVVLNPVKVYAKENIRFHLEMIDADAERDYEAIRARRIIENIGYDVSAGEFKNEEQIFVFDSYALQEFANRLRDRKPIAFLLRPSSAQKLIKNSAVEWHSTHPDFTPKLVIEYLHKRRRPVPPVSDLNYKIENGRIKLTWKNPDDKDFRGVFVIKNPFRKPISPYDGDKLYGGPDNWTFDDFGALDVKKYYALFTYDDVPNFSEPVILEYRPKK